MVKQIDLPNLGPEIPKDKTPLPFNLPDDKVSSPVTEDQFILNPNPPQINQGSETELSENPSGRFKTL